MNKLPLAGPSMSGSQKTEIVKNAEQNESTRSLSYLRWGLVITAGMILWGLSLCLPFSETFTGIEFSPYSFQTRPFQYTKNSLGSRLLGSKSGGTTTIEPSTPACSNAINQFLTTSTRSPTAMTRWDLSQYSGLIEPTIYRGEASVLVAALQMVDKSNSISIWEKWSSDYPERAALLWPAIQQLAINHTYFAIPELLTQVRTVESLDELDTLLKNVSFKNNVSVKPTSDK